jgi:hypothetical protein
MLHNESARRHVNHLISRLALSSARGLRISGAEYLAARARPGRAFWAMKSTSDRQRTLAAHGVPISDQRLPLQVLDLRQLTTVEGRILVHGTDEQ